MVITGKDLIAMGYRPGKWFSEVLTHLSEVEMTEAELKSFLDSKQPNIIHPHEVGLAYFKNIKAESEIENENIASVFATMDELMKTPTIVSGAAVLPEVRVRSPWVVWWLPKMRFILRCTLLMCVVQ